MRLFEEESPVRYTERDMLDALHARYSEGYPPRYVVAEHVRSACGG